MVNEKKTRTYKEQEFIYQSQINAVSTISTTVQKVVFNFHTEDNSVFVIKINPPYDMTVDLSENTIWSG